MAWYLQFDGVNDYVNTGRLILGAGLNITFDIQRDSDVNIYLTDDSGDELRYIVGTGWQVRISNTYYTWSEAALIPPIGQRFTVTFARSGSTSTRSVQINNGTPVTKTTGTNNFWFNNIGRGVGGLYQPFRLYGCTTSHTPNTTYTRNYDPSASGGSGTILPDTSINAINGTLVNFTVPDCWIYYNSITTTGIPNSTLGAALNQACAINLNNYFTGATSYSVVSGSLPTGLSIVGNQIVGTPTTAQSTSLVIRASNSIDTLDSATITFNTGLWALRFSGVDSRVIIPNGMAGNIGQSEYSLRVKSGPSGITLPASGNRGLITAYTSGTTGLVVTSTGLLEVYMNNSRLYGGATQLIFSGVAFDYTLTHLANGSWNIYNNITNSATGQSGSYVGNVNTNWTLSQFGKSLLAHQTDSAITGDIALIAVTGLTNAQTWDASLSGGVGTLFRTTTDVNNGTQAGTWPADDGEWISYAPAGGTELAASVFNVSTLTSSVTTGSTLACVLQTSTLLTGSLTKGVSISSVLAGSSSLTVDLTEADPGLSSDLVSSSLLSCSLVTGVSLSSSMAGRSFITVSLYTEQDQESGGVLQNKKLILINDSSEAYPDNTINDAMDTYLEQRYTASGGLSDLIARYLGE